MARAGTSHGPRHSSARSMQASSSEAIARTGTPPKLTREAEPSTAAASRVACREGECSGSSPWFVGRGAGIVRGRQGSSRIGFLRAPCTAGVESSS